MADRQYISKVKLTPTDTVPYYIKDEEARDLIAKLGEVSRFLGVTTTEIEDGDEIVDSYSGITIPEGGIKAGDIIIYASTDRMTTANEFIAVNLNSALRWSELGDIKVNNLGSLAYVNTASGSTSYTPSGTISKPTFTGSSFNSTGSFTPSGTVSQPTFTGSKVTLSQTISLTKTNITVSASTTATPSGNPGYTPAGSVSQPTFTGNVGTVSVSGSTTGELKDLAFDGTAATITSKNGSVVSVSLSSSTTTSTGAVGVLYGLTRTVDVALSSTTVNSITDVGALPSMEVDNETLTFYPGTLPTKGANTTVATAVKTQPTFTGSTTYIKGNIAANGITVTSSYTPAGTVTGSFSGTTATFTGTYTPSGTVSKPTFAGTKTYLYTNATTASQANVSIPYTPSGTVSKPTFTGSAGTVTVSGTPSGEVSKPTFTGNSGTISITVSADS